MANLSESQLSGLTKTERESFNFLRSQSKPGASPTQILRDLRQAGYKINTQKGLDIIATLQDRADVSRFIRAFGPNATIPGSLHKVSVLDFSDGAKFQYLVGTNSSNELIPEAIFVNSRVPLSENEVFARAQAAFHYEEGTGLAETDFPDVFLTIDDARHAPGEQATGEAGGGEFTGLGVS